LRITSGFREKFKILVAQVHHFPAFGGSGSIHFKIFIFFFKLPKLYKGFVDWTCFFAGLCYYCTLLDWLGLVAFGPWQFSPIMRDL
jgi:hypothetical protein